MSPSRVTANRRPLSLPSDDESDEEILLVEQQDQKDSVEEEEEEEAPVMQDCERKCQSMPESATTSQRVSSSESASEEEESESEKEAPVIQKRKRKSLAEQSDPKSAHTTQQAHSKKFSQRVWSDDDELAILNGMISHGGSFDLNLFYDSIKKSVHFDVSKSQLSAKIRKLKSKYKNVAVKGKLSGCTPHELQVYELAKIIWDGEIDRADKKKSMQNPRDGSTGKVKLPNIPAAPSRCLSESIRSDKTLGSSGLSQNAIKQGLESMEVAKRSNLEEEWKKLEVAEMELYLRRVELIEQQAELLLEVIKSSSTSRI